VIALAARRAAVREGWELHLNHPGIPATIPASVPGCIHIDLINANLIDDISQSGRESDQRWIGRTDSVFTKSLVISVHSEFTYLHFKGLDTVGRIFINNALRLDVNNMHRSYWLDVSGQAREGLIDIRVEFDAPLADAENQVEKLGLYPRPYDMPYNYQRKMACSYGWDWGPTTISSGIWRDVELLQFDVDSISSFSPLTTLNSDGSGKIEIELETLRHHKEFTVEVRRGGQLLASKKNALEIYLSDVEVWNPIGFGEPNLYEVTLSLQDGDNVIDEITRTIGFRTVELDTSTIVDNQHRFALVVNGNRIWVKGVNWIPDDPFPSRISPERYEGRIQEMLAANINAIRVWGGGIYETDEFYELCNRNGIIVWQDFLFACAAYPETPEYEREFEAEARENVLRLRSNPSLVLWCGGNECIEGFQHWGWQEELQGKPWGSTYYFQVIPKVLLDLDGTRAYIPGSPWSSHEEDVKAFNSGTNHIWDVWNERGYERYEEYSPAFNAEFGWSGPGSWAMLTKSIGKSNLDSRDPDLALHQKAFDGMDKMADAIVREFARHPVEGPSWYFATALVQARAVEVGLKHFRSLTERCSGTILWQFNDMWPAMSWAVLDHTGFRKLAWHAMRKAYAPRSVFIGRMDQGGVLTFLNENHAPWIGTVELSLIDVDGRIIDQYAESKIVDPHSYLRMSAVDIFPILKNELDGFILLKFGSESFARRTILAPATTAPKQDLEVRTALTTAGIDISIRANKYLHDLSILPELIDSKVVVSDQMISLLPGDVKVFQVTCNSDVAQKISANPEGYIWSHNRLVNS
jgi:beta-mannosidase